MKLSIDGKEYPIVSHKGAQILFLLELQQQTREFYPPSGVGARTLYELEASAKAAAKDKNGPPQDAMLWLAIVTFLSRRAAGENITFRDAVSCNPDFIKEEGDVFPGEADGTQDPTEPDASPEIKESDPEVSE